MSSSSSSYLSFLYPYKTSRPNVPVHCEECAIPIESTKRNRDLVNYKCKFWFERNDEFKGEVEPSEECNCKCDCEEEELYQRTRHEQMRLLAKKQANRPKKKKPKFVNVQTNLTTDTVGIMLTFENRKTRRLPFSSPFY